MTNKRLNIEDFFETEEIKRLGEETLEITPQSFSQEQKCAILKAVLYIISADSIITPEENNFYLRLIKELECDEILIKKSIELPDELMFKCLQEVNEKQEGYIVDCLNKAALIDNELAKEEQNLIDLFTQYIPKGQKPKDFYNKLLNL